jgi:hypothetical protein
MRKLELELLMQRSYHRLANRFRRIFRRRQPQEPEDLPDGSTMASAVSPLPASRVSLTGGSVPIGRN